MVYEEFDGNADAVGLLGSALPVWLGLPISICVLLGIAFAYKGHGTMGLTLLTSYIMSLIVTTLTMKQIMAEFPYPLFMTTLHFVFSLMGVLACFKFTGEPYPKSDIACPTFQGWLMRSILPPAICVYVSIVLNNMSLIYIGAAINGMIGLATPVVTAMMAASFGMKVAMFAWVGILVAVGGDTIMTLSGLSTISTDAQSVHVYFLGVALSVAAMCARGAKTVLQDKMMNHYGTGEEEPKLTPLGLWYFQGPLLCSIGIPAALAFEGIGPIQALSTILANPLLLIANVVAAMGVNIFGMCTIKMLGAPAAQIAGKFNVLVAATLACTFMGETLTVVQGLSGLLIVGGAAIFEKAQEKKLNDVQGILAEFQGEKYDTISLA